MMGARAYGGFNNPTWEHLRDWQDIFSGIFAYGRWSFNLAPGAEAPPVNGNYVSGRYFDTLGVHAALGRTLTRTDDTRGCAGNAVLSYRFWQQEFGGNPNVVGRAISIDRHPIPVVGVAQPGFDGVEVGGSADLILPLCAVTLIRNGDSSLLDINYLPVGWLQVMGRLKPENLRRASQGTPESAGDLQSHSLGSGNASGRWPPMAARTSDQFLKGTFDIEPAANGISYLRREYRQALIVLFAMVGVVLLIACVNLANLLLARGAARRHEIAVRITPGVRSRTPDPPGSDRRPIAIGHRRDAGSSDRSMGRSPAGSIHLTPRSISGSMSGCSRSRRRSPYSVAWHSVSRPPGEAHRSIRRLQ